jgi:hypothetical protein
MKALIPSLSLLPLLLLGACSTGSSGGDDGLGSGTLEVLATDAPFEHKILKTATIEIERIRVHQDAQGESPEGWITIYEGDPIEIQLEKLRNGITRGVAEKALPEGSYRQMRLHLSGGSLELKNGNVYTTDDGSLDMPSAMTSSGYKLFFDPPIEVPEGGREAVLIDFDLMKTFKPVPANNAENAHSYKLHPVLRGAAMSVSGEIRVLVLEDDGNGGTVGVADATVHVLLPGETDPAKSLATTATEADGSAAVIGLFPVTYDVLATKDGREATVTDVVVTTGNVTAIEITLP